MIKRRNVVSVIDNGVAFTYSDSEPKLWANEDDIWLHGYCMLIYYYFLKYIYNLIFILIMMFDIGGVTWADKHLQVDTIDYAKQLINISSLTPPNFGMKAGDP